MPEATSVTAEVAAGALAVGGEIAASAVDMVRNATETMANVVTGSTPDEPPPDAEEPDRTGRGDRKDA